MITDFIDSVLIIDDQEKEIEELAKKLQEEDISVKIQIVNPQDKQFKDIIPLKRYRQLIFIDLSLDDNIDIKNNISTEIRPILLKILPKTKGCYGLVVWSKHTNDISILKEDADIIVSIKNETRRFHLPDNMARRTLSNHIYENGQLKIMLDY